MLNISRDIDLKNSKIESILNKMFHPDWLRATAVKMGFVQRNRKIDPAVFFWVLVLGFGVGMKRTIASLRRSYETVSAETLVPSSFYVRFNKGLIAYLKECLSHGIEELCQYTSIRLSNKLADFKDIIVSDGTVIALHEKLASLFPGTRRKAELKIHLVSGITGNTKSVAVYPGKTADVKTMRIGTWVENNILLFDLGYYKHEVFSKIIHYKGYFVSRLKDNSNPTIVTVIQENEACSENIEGKKFKEILPKLKGKVVDLQVMISFKGQKITGKESAQEEDYKIYRRKEGADKNTIALRLVGVFNDESKEYHFYLTNINPNQLTAEEIALLYRVRWSIELTFKELKSYYKLDIIKTGTAEVVESLVYVAMLTLIVSQRLLNHIRSITTANIARITNLRWSEVFYAVEPIIMERVIREIGVEEDPLSLMVYLLTESVDPNVTRKKPRLMSDWIENSQEIAPNN